MGVAALKIGPGEEAMMTDTNRIATAAPIVHLRARPVFVDMLPERWCIDLKLAETAITPCTTAIVGVDLCGNLGEMDHLLSMCSLSSPQRQGGQLL